MKTGISSIDSVVGELPRTGIIAITGDSQFYQSALTKAIGIRVGQEMPGIVVSTEYRQWETPDVSKTLLSILDSEDPFRHIDELKQCDLGDYGVLIFDSMPAQATVFAKQKIEVLSADFESKLLLVNIRRSPLVHGYDIESGLVCDSQVTIKVTESQEKDKVKLTIFGKYLGNRTINHQTLTKERT